MCKCLRTCNLLVGRIGSALIYILQIYELIQFITRQGGNPVFDSKMSGLIKDRECAFYAIPNNLTSKINVEKAGMGPLLRVPYPMAKGM